ncbi:vomeronasal type-2 receptor 26-like [Pyxicephalus adspersus]|uniref:vomeronasal type-2 receptor 26-like n=1 Tax=Pyxicephalus adspersus TaxID=30357 RepID=UPI003B5D02F0
MFNLENDTSVNGSLRFIMQKNENPAFIKFVKEVKPNRFPAGRTFSTWWDELCENRCPFNPRRRNCTGVESGRQIMYSHCNLRFTGMSYIVYNSVYAVAYALHEMYQEIPLSERLKDKNKLKFQDLRGWKLHYFLKKVDFINKLGDRIYFKNNEMSPEYDIYNLLYLPNGTLKANLVGNLSQSDPERIGLTIDADTITWDRSFSGIPKSTCANDCPPGFWKFRREGQAVCCFDCIPCPEGKVSPWTNSELCMFCPKEEWSNENKTQCIPKTISFLSYQDPLGIALTAIASGFSATSITILGIFLKYRETPIAKANNRTLSYILLTSITFSFLGSLFFIGQPHKWTCFLRQPIFGISFAIAVSSILAKSLTTVVAFNVHHPGRFIRSYVRVKTPILIVLICPCVQVLICFFWLVCSAPYPNYLNSGTKEIIFHCNEGSVLFFYLVLVYMCVLAGLSFILAFLSRSLPDTFNEAKYITFSMLMFFIVWISFILCYLSSKGKEVETLEIFAILTSNAALLICIFAPKLNIIILQPHKNNRKILHPIALKKYGQQK